MQENNRKNNILFLPKYLQGFFCFILCACVYYNNIIFKHQLAELNVYLVINLAIFAILWFFIGLAIISWALKSENKNIPVIKMVIAVAVLVLADQAVQVILSKHSEAAAPVAGNWITFHAAMSDRNPSLFFLRMFPWINILLVFFGIFFYRYVCFRAEINKRLICFFIIFYIAIFLCMFLSMYIHGGVFTFISVKNFIDFGIIDIYLNACLLTLVLCIFYKNYPETKKESKLKAYFRYEKENIKNIFSRSKKDASAGEPHTLQ